MNSFSSDGQNCGTTDAAKDLVRCQFSVQSDTMSACRLVLTNDWVIGFSFLGTALTIILLLYFYSTVGWKLCQTRHVEEDSDSEGGTEDSIVGDGNQNVEVPLPPISGLQTSDLYKAERGQFVGNINPMVNKEAAMRSVSDVRLERQQRQNHHPRTIGANLGQNSSGDVQDQFKRTLDSVFLGNVKASSSSSVSSPRHDSPTFVKPNLGSSTEVAGNGAIRRFANSKGFVIERDNSSFVPSVLLTQPNFPSSFSPRPPPQQESRMPRPTTDDFLSPGTKRSPALSDLEHSRNVGSGSRGSPSSLEQRRYFGEISPIPRNEVSTSANMTESNRERPVLLGGGVDLSLNLDTPRALQQSHTPSANKMNMPKYTNPSTRGNSVALKETVIYTGMKKSDEGIIADLSSSSRYAKEKFRGGMLRINEHRDKEVAVESSGPLQELQDFEPTTPAQSVAEVEETERIQQLRQKLQARVAKSRQTTVVDDVMILATANMVPYELPQSSNPGKGPNATNKTFKESSSISGMKPTLPSAKVKPVGTEAPVVIPESRISEGERIQQLQSKLQARVASSPLQPIVNDNSKSKAIAASAKSGNFPSSTTDSYASHILQSQSTSSPNTTEAVKITSIPRISKMADRKLALNVKEKGTDFSSSGFTGPMKRSSSTEPVPSSSAIKASESARVVDKRSAKKPSSLPMPPSTSDSGGGGGVSKLQKALAARKANILKAPKTEIVPADTHKRPDSPSDTESLL